MCMGKEKLKYLAKATVIDTKESLIPTNVANYYFLLIFVKYSVSSFMWFPLLNVFYYQVKKSLFTYFNKLSTLFPMEEHQVEKLLLSF